MQMTPHIFDSGESISNYEYMRKFEANIAKASCARNLYQIDLWKKNRKMRLIAMSL